MAEPIDRSVLNTPIYRLPVSEDFIIMAKANGFTTLQEILNKPLHEFHTWPQSGYRMLREFMNLLDTYGLMQLAGRVRK